MNMKLFPAILIGLAVFMPVRSEVTADAISKSVASVGKLVGSYDNKPEKEKKSVTYNEVEYTVYPLKKGTKEIGATVMTSATGFSGQLIVMVGFDSEGQITGYEVLQQTETPGWGSVVGEWFQKEGKGNVVGKDMKKGDLKVTQDGGEVDGITRSTITSRAFLHAVNSAYKVYQGKEPEKQEIQAGGHHGHGGPGGPGQGGRPGPGQGGPQGGFPGGPQGGFPGGGPQGNQQ